VKKERKKHAVTAFTAFRSGDDGLEAAPPGYRQPKPAGGIIFRCTNARASLLEASAQVPQYHASDAASSPSGIANNFRLVIYYRSAGILGTQSPRSRKKKEV
jgi:hypothetical protein